MASHLEAHELLVPQRRYVLGAVGQALGTIQHTPPPRARQPRELLRSVAQEASADGQDVSPQPAASNPMHAELLRREATPYC